MSWARSVARRELGFTTLALRFCCPAEGFQAFISVYAYFRWADDEIDRPGRDPVRTTAFAEARLAALHADDLGPSLPERALAAVWRDPVWGARVRPSVLRMWEALAFDAGRTADPASVAEVEAQIARVGDAYLFALWGCSGAEGEAPPALYGLARGATRAHLVRDLHVDLAIGYRNVPVGMEHAAWSADFAKRALVEIAAGRAALPAVTRRRTRWLLAIYAWKYERLALRLLAGLS